MQSSTDGDTLPHDDAATADSEAWGMWDAGLAVGSIVVGAAGLFAIGWAVERFIIS